MWKMVGTNCSVGVQYQGKTCLRKQKGEGERPRTHCFWNWASILRFSSFVFCRAAASKVNSRTMKLNAEVKKAQNARPMSPRNRATVERTQRTKLEMGGEAGWGREREQCLPPPSHSRVHDDNAYSSH